MPATLRERLIALIEPLIGRLGYELVELEQTPGRGSAVVRLFIDSPEGVGLKDCERVSREVSALLDVADPIASAYTLEVSSPGIDRPLVRPEDYDRFAGFEAQLDLAQPQDGRKRFRGRLIGRAEDAVRLAGPAGEVRLPLAAITKAKLILTDDLLALAQSKPAQAH